MSTKLIGKGAFTKAYLLDSGRVMLRSEDPIKECMAHGWFPEHRLFPVVEQVDQFVYEMDFYPKAKSLATALNARDFAFYKLLRVMAETINAKAVNARNADRHSILHEVIDSYSEANSEYSEEFDAIKEAVDACGNYGSDIGFEISPRNVAVSPDGGLVLLDCFFIVSALRALRK